MPNTLSHPDVTARPVVILGRPNVGKSTLFNRLVGRRLALVDDQPGVTRDRRAGAAHLAGLDFTLVDTAGWEEADPASLTGRMRAQTEASLEGAAVVLFVIDARAGLTPLDRAIAGRLRGRTVPVIVVANKAEGRIADAGVYEAFGLGLGEPVALSAEHGEGLAELFAALRPHLEDANLEDDSQDESEPDNPGPSAPAENTPPETVHLSAILPPTMLTGDAPNDAETDDADPDAPDTTPLKLAIVGRPNAGKSTLINALLGQDRLLTGPEAGITRDAIAIDWLWHERSSGLARAVRLIDTAGLRKRARVADKLEAMAAADARRAIDFAEVVVLLLDATRGLEHQDLRIAGQVIEEGRALIIAVNKWDVAQGPSALFQGIRAALGEGLAELDGVPLLAVSARTAKGLDALLKAAFTVRAAWSRRVPTGLLNRWFAAALAQNPPPAPGGRRIKLRYITQARTRPPSFVLFGNRLDELPESYRRYLVNGIRRSLGFSEVPVRLTLRSSHNPFAPITGGEAPRRRAPPKRNQALSDGPDPKPAAARKAPSPKAALSKGTLPKSGTPKVSSAKNSAPKRASTAPKRGASHGLGSPPKRGPAPNRGPAPGRR